jgi:minichromosome maintenance protein 10
MDIDLFLFGKAFQETWKIQKGMIIVLLNPSIMKSRDGNGFTLKMTQNKSPLSLKQKNKLDENGCESILEVGFSKDLGFCEALRANKTACGAWVDTRHSKVCEWHVDQNVKKLRSQRMEYAVGYEFV